MVYVPILKIREWQAVTHVDPVYTPEACHAKSRILVHGMPQLTQITPTDIVSVYPIQCCYGTAHVFQVPSDDEADHRRVLIRDIFYEHLQIEPL